MRRERDEELFYDSRVPEGEEPDDKPELKLTRQERRWVILGAMKSALLIGLLYVAAGGILIWLMLRLWQ